MCHGRHFACAVAFVCARRRSCCFCVHTQRCGTGLLSPTSAHCSSRSKKTFHALLAAEADGADDLEDLWSKLDKRIFPFANETLKHKAATLEGFRIQTRALIVTALELWDDEDDAQLAPYLRSACGLCNLPLPPSRTLPEAETKDARSRATT